MAARRPGFGRSTISSGRIGAGEQVTQRPLPPQCQANPPSMLWPVVQQMAALAERLDVAMPAPAVAGIVVEMGSCQHDLGRPYRRAI